MRTERDAGERKARSQKRPPVGIKLRAVIEGFPFGETLDLPPNSVYREI